MSCILKPRFCSFFNQHQSSFKNWSRLYRFLLSWATCCIVLLIFNYYNLFQWNSLLLTIFISFLLALFLRAVIRNNIDHDNQIQDLDDAKDLIFARDKKLKEASCNLKETFSKLDPSAKQDLLTDEQIFFLSSTDLFVEKAQAVLTRRGKFLIRAGIVTMIGAFFLLTLGFVFAIFSQNEKFQDYLSTTFTQFIPPAPTHQGSNKNTIINTSAPAHQRSDKTITNNTSEPTHQGSNKTITINTSAPTHQDLNETITVNITVPPDQNVSNNQHIAPVNYSQNNQVRKDDPQNGWQNLILKLFSTLGVTAYIYVSVKLLISLSRSFFHEGLSLFERRHALRFGRMYLYLKKGVVSEKWLETFFQWNKETKTSFLDMKPEVVTETLLHKLFGMFSDAGHAAKNTKINTGF